MKLSNGLYRNTKSSEVFLKSMILVLTFMGVAIAANAQVMARSQGDLDLITKVTLGVVVKSPDEKQVKKLSKKPEELEAYTKSIDQYNSYLKEAVNSEWHLSKDIKFISETEAEALKERRDENFSILETGLLTNYVMGQTTVTSQNFKQASTNPTAYRHYGALNESALMIRSAAHPKSFLLATAVPVTGLSEGAMKYCIQQLSNQITDYEQLHIIKNDARVHAIEARTPELKNKTLLFCEEVVDFRVMKQITDKTLKADVYPYPNELVDYERLDEVIKNKDERYAYAFVVPNQIQSQGSQQYVYMIVDAKDGHIMYYTEKAALTGKFSEYHIKKLTEQVSK